MSFDSQPECVIIVSRPQTLKPNRLQNLSLPIRAAIVSLICMIVCSGGLLAQTTEQVLHVFSYQKDGGFPFAGLTLDSTGNLYGVSYLGGSGSGVCCGVVFELSPTGSGWGFKVLHTFTGPDFDGEAPSGSPILDASGNLYGTTQLGGFDGCGVVYELSPTKQGEWNETILHSFNHFPVQNTDGCLPASSLVFDQHGNLYGTTQQGGGIDYQGLINCSNDGCGSVFKLVKSPTKGWRETVIHSFPDGSNDGINPYGGLAIDDAGNLWGTTTAGTISNGTVFKLTPNANGTWSETGLFNFTGDSTGWFPYSGLIADSTGNFYGTTFYGGLGAGAVFEITPQANGELTETLIYQFNPCGSTECADGLFPFGSLISDQAGNLYGTAALGGGAGQFCNPSKTLKEGCGVVFKLSPQSGGAWNYSIVYRFAGDVGGAYLTDDHLTIDANGNIYGTTYEGGDVNSESLCPNAGNGLPGCGIVFELKP
jgi:hypothetical protein